MKQPGGGRRRLDLALLRVASLLVPPSRRAEWLREWRGELKAWRDAGRGTTRVAMGAFPHAMWLFGEGWTMRMESLARDFQIGARALLKRPLFSAAVVATLAIGIGGAVAVFSVVDAVLLRALPYPEGDRVVVLGEANDDGSLGTTSFATATDWRERSGSFDGLAIVRGSSGTLTGKGDPEEITGMRASWNYFDVLGVHPELGRAYVEADDHASSERVLVLSHGLWVRRFGADPAVVGRAVTLSGTDFTVAGVMPATFEPLVSAHFYAPAQYWTPLRYELGSPDSCRTCRHLHVVARLAPDVSLARARAEISDITRTLAAEHPDDYRYAATVVNTLRADMAGPVRKPLWVLFAAVGLVLLTACANVASLMVARATDRRREVSLRAALGAGTVDLVGQMSSECLLLAAAGGGAGLVLAQLGTVALVAFAPATVPGIEHVGVDWAVAGFAALVTLLTATIFGLGPIVQSTRADPLSALKEGGRGTTGDAYHRARRALVGSEIAVAIVLLVGVGLMSRSFVRVLSVDPGFDPAGLVKMQVNADGSAYDDDDDVLAFHQEVLRRVLLVPGVASAGLSSQAPLTGDYDRVGIAIEGVPADPADRPISPERYMVAGDYLGTMRIPLIEGRTFDGRDTPDGTPVVLVNETFARRYWPDVGALGNRIRMGSDTAPWATVVGVVGDVRHYALEQPADAQIYVPQSQRAASYMTLVVRARGEPAAVVDGVRQAVWSIDHDIAVPQVATFDELVEQVTAQRRFVLGLMSVFAAVAVVLTVVGIYALLAYHVAQRTREIGIRMALGAEHTDVFGLIVGEGMALSGFGVVAGLGGALVLSRFVTSMLYGVEPTDPITLASVTLLMLGVSFAACWLPARRAMRVDAPMVLSGE